MYVIAHPRYYAMFESSLSNLVYYPDVTKSTNYATIIQLLYRLDSILCMSMVFQGFLTASNTQGPSNY